MPTLRKATRARVCATWATSPTAPAIPCASMPRPKRASATPNPTGCWDGPIARDSYCRRRCEELPAHMPCIIPQTDHRLGEVMFVTECAQAGGAQDQKSAGSRFEPEPAGSQDAQEMGTGKKQHVALDRANPANHAVGAAADLGRRFPSRTAVAEYMPARTFLVDIGAGAAFVISVIPFDQVAVDLGLVSKTGQFAGPASALQRTGEYTGEGQAAQPVSQAAGVALAPFGQRQISETRMLAR